jgi:hypothetical protein
MGDNPISEIMNSCQSNLHGIDIESRVVTATSDQVVAQSGSCIAAMTATAVAVPLPPSSFQHAPSSLIHEYSRSCRPTGSSLTRWVDPTDHHRQPPPLEQQAQILLLALLLLLLMHIE